MGKTRTYVDNSNFFIEGQRISAVKRGLAPSLKYAMDHKIVDRDWIASYGSLYSLICEGKTIGDAKLWGSIPPNDAFWKMVESHGFKAKAFDRDQIKGGEKKVDVAIAFQMAMDSQTFGLDDEIILVAGDKDFCPAVEGLTERGFKITIAGWGHSTARELIDLVSGNFVSLDGFHDQLGTVLQPTRIIQPAPKK